MIKAAQASLSVKCSSNVEQITHARAAESMWIYYRDNKAQLHGSVREYREHILERLMAGVSVAQVFAPFILPPEPVKVLRKKA